MRKRGAVEEQNESTNGTNYIIVPKLVDGDQPRQGRQKVAPPVRAGKTGVPPSR